MSRLMRVAAALGLWPLWMAPSRFRSEYRRTAVTDFAEMLRAEHRRRGLAPMLVLWARGLFDAMRTVWMERRADQPTPGRPFSDLSTDLRGALRAAGRSPAFSATIVLTLVFGLGLAAAIFAFADGYLFRPLPFTNPEQLYLVRVPDAPGEFLRAPEAEALRTSHLEALGFVEGVGSAPVTFAMMTIGSRTVQLHVAGIGSNFGQITGVPLVAGRYFTAEDYRGIEPIPIWLTHWFWQSEFGGDRGVIGRRFVVRDGRRQVQVEVVGITDARITTFNTRFGRSNELPAAFGPAVSHSSDSNILATPIVRLSGSWTVERATAAIAAALQSIAPGKDGAHRTVRLDPLSDELGRSGRSTAVLFIIGAALALALVTVNLVHLLLTRGAARTAEIATRSALGASRWRIARLFLTESLAYGVLGSAGGLVLGAWLTSILAANIPRRGAEAGTLATVVMRFDARVAIVAIAMGMLVAMLGGLWPAWRALRRPLAIASRRSSGVGARVSAGTSKLILTSQVALATVVLIGAVFSGTGLWRLMSRPLGYDLADRFIVGFPDAPGRAASGSTDWPALQDALRRAPGVSALAASFDELREPVRVGGRTFERGEVVGAGVGVQYFAAAGHELVRGRFPDDGEMASLARIAIVDDLFARAAWPAASPIGSRVQVGATIYDVVGVIKHPRYSLLHETPPFVFVPAPPANERVGVRVWAPGLTAATLTERFSAIMRTTAPQFYPNVREDTFERRFDDELANARFQRPIIIVLALFAFTVAAVGLFGLMAYLVEQRTREFGIRLALGARARDVRHHLVAESFCPASVGVVIGLAAAWLLQGVMRATMYGWESSGPLAAVAVAILMLLVALLAIAGPARRVLRIDPALTLRAE